MDRLIYTSLTALRGVQSRQTVTANNLANVTTPGFRGDLAEAQSLWLQGGEANARAMASEEVLAADMQPGVVNATGRDLDIALSDNALLAVQAENGEEGYTRRGDLMLSESGLLTTGDGRPVLGSQGPLVIPPADRISIAPDGGISIIPPGGDPNQPQIIDRLKLVSFDSRNTVKAIDGLFRGLNGSTLPEDPDARLVPGHLEASNVSATHTLVEMIEASRAWDTQLKLISSARDLDSATADLMRLPD
jgi:flagellar basal-body rod protein FlgF